ncbi:hypothetical protein M758_6G021000 [Ceratodon purpureus]|nr:hypothetical protein M758_6G021000 [Ceratodon purpureus]
MYLLPCPRVKLRHAIANWESGFITRGSPLSALGRGSHHSSFSRLCLRGHGFHDGRMRRSPARQLERIGSVFPFARCDGRGDDAGGVGREGIVSKVWGALSKPIVFPDVTKFVKDLTPMERKLWGAGIVCVLAGVAWLQNLAAAGLVDDTEPLFAEAARQMLVTGDYVTPQFNAQPRFDKPILIYWLMALSGKLLGPSVWALRLPSAICAVGLLLGLLMTVKEFGVRTSVDDAKAQSDESQGPLSRGEHYVPAFITIAAFALNFEVVAWGSTALSDMLLTSMLAGSLLSFFWGYVGRKLTPSKHEWGYSVSAIFMGLACLSKGPIGIAFPVLVCTLFLLSTGELLEILVKEMPYWKGILALSIINVPWYGVMAAKHGLTYIYTFFGYHNIERFMQGVNHHGGRPWWYGLAVVAIMYFPWSLSLPPALLQAGPWRQSKSMAKRYQNLSLFAASWFIAGFLLFALSSSQLPSYYLPVAPAIAILAAVHASNAVSQKKGGLLSRLVPATLYLSLAVGFWFLPACLQTSGDTVAVRIGRLISNRHLHKIPVMLFGLAGIVTIRTAEFGSPVGETSVEKTTRTFLPMWAVHATVMACFLGIFVTPVYRLADGIRQAPLRDLAYAAATQQKFGEPLVMVGTRMPSVVYYSKLPTAFFNSPQEASMAIQQEAAPWVTSALIITETDADLFQPPPDILATSGDYKLLRLHRGAELTADDISFQSLPVEES